MINDLHDQMEGEGMRLIKTGDGPVKILHIL